MKKSTIWILGIVMGLSFLSLLYLQVSYIEEMVKMRREQFDESVRRSLDQACRNIELVETKKYLEDDVVATERAAQLYRQQAAKEGKEEKTDGVCQSPGNPLRGNRRQPGTGRTGGDDQGYDLRRTDPGAVHPTGRSTPLDN